METEVCGVDSEVAVRQEGWIKGASIDSNNDDTVRWVNRRQHGGQSVKRTMRGGHGCILEARGAMEVNAVAVESV